MFKHIKKKEKNYFRVKNTVPLQCKLGYTFKGREIPAENRSNFVTANINYNSQGTCITLGLEISPNWSEERIIDEINKALLNYDKMEIEYTVNDNV